MTNEQELRERFDKFVAEVAARNPAGISDVWINSAWQGCKFGALAERQMLDPGFRAGIRAGVEKERQRCDKVLKAASIKLRAAQLVVHFGQYHQWGNFDICTDKGCAAVREMLAEMAIRSDEDGGQS